MPTLTVTIKHVYGNRTVYPACDVSRKLAKLIGAKTFTDRVIAQLKDLGYGFAVQPDAL